MSPDQINQELGKPVWKCYHCKAESGLHWFNGWSVAVCNKPECSKTYSDMCIRQLEEEDAYQQHVLENY